MNSKYMTLSNIMNTSAFKRFLRLQILRSDVGLQIETEIIKLYNEGKLSYPVEDLQLQSVIATIDKKNGWYGGKRFHRYMGFHRFKMEGTNAEKSKWLQWFK